MTNSKPTCVERLYQLGSIDRLYDSLMNWSGFDCKLTLFIVGNIMRIDWYVQKMFIIKDEWNELNSIIIFADGTRQTVSSVSNVCVCMLVYYGIHFSKTPITKTNFVFYFVLLVNCIRHNIVCKWSFIPDVLMLHNKCLYSSCTQPSIHQFWFFWYIFSFYK